MITYPFEAPPAPGDATRIAEGVLWLRIPLPMPNLDHVNIYALDEGDSWSVIDTGLDTGACRKAWQAALDGPLAGKPVRRVILTHHHPDHVGLAGWFVSNGAELWTTRTAWLFARMLRLDEQAVPNAETLRFWTEAGMPEPILAQRRLERPFNFADCVAPMPLGFRRIEEGDELVAAGRRWRVLCGHGHAPDHLTLWSQDDELVLGGDQLLPSISPNLGAYATEPLADTVGDWLVSCRRFQDVARPEHLVLPGHKVPYSGLPERLVQMIENHVSALDRLRAHLREPRSAVECFVPIFGRQISGSAFGLALVEAVGHLNHLLAQGEVARHKRADGAWAWQMLEEA
ncbi:MAG: MBL fold metallo-hydrolase [Pseudomonadota bacterium]